MTIYRMPINVIKRILLDENEKFFSSYHGAIFMLDYYHYAKVLIENEINNLKSYDDIEDFIHKSRRMSLTNWIETL